MSQIKLGAILNYVIIGLNTFVGLAYTPYMLKCLGQNEYGLYSLVASIIAYLTILDFGFGNAIIRYTAKFRAEGKTNEQWTLFGMFLIIYSIIGIIAFGGGLGLYCNVDILFNKTMSFEELGQARIMMLLLTFNLTFTFPLSIFGSIITAYENFVFQRLVNISRILISTMVMILVLAIGYKAIALVIVQTIFNLLTLIINVIYCRRKLKIKIIIRKFDWSFLKEISTYSFWIFLNAIVEKVYWGTGQFVLGATIGPSAVAIFSIAILLQQMYIQFSAAIANVLLPKITAMVSAKKSEHDFSDIFIKTGRIQSLILSLILSGFIVFGQGFINLWAGNTYNDAYYIAIIFFISLYIPLIQNTGVAILQARNKLMFRSISYVAISLVSLILQIIFSKYWGAYGCAVAVGSALLFGQGLVMNIYYNKVQKIDIRKFWIEVSKCNCASIIITIISTYISYNVHYTNWMVLFTGIIVFLLIYLPIIWKTGMNDWEKSLIYQPLLRVLGITR